MQADTHEPIKERKKFIGTVRSSSSDGKKVFGFQPQVIVQCLTFIETPVQIFKVTGHKVQHRINPKTGDMMIM